MSAHLYAIAIDFGCALAAILVMLPLLLYLAVAWRTRRDKLFAYLSPEALAIYYKQFLELELPADIQKEFRKRFGRLYGRRHYALPLLLLGSSVVVGAWALGRTVQVWEHIAPDIHSIPPVAASAFAGGLMWIVFDELGRLRRRDFTVTDTYNYVFRLWLAVPLGYALSATIKDPIAAPVAFLLGAFPTGTVFLIARRVGSQKLGLGEQATTDSDTASTELENLQCVGKGNAERFQDEGITTIAALAWADPIDVTIRTNFEINYVIDCISQALLWIYLREDVRKLYVLGIRGAQEAWWMLQWRQDAKLKTQVEKTLQQAATTLNISEDALLITLRQVALDPYTEFLNNVWH